MPSGECGGFFIPHYEKGIPQKAFLVAMVLFLPDS